MILLFALLIIIFLQKKTLPCDNFSKSIAFSCEKMRWGTQIKHLSLFVSVMKGVRCFRFVAFVSTTTTNSQVNSKYTKPRKPQKGSGERMGERSWSQVLRALDRSLCSQQLYEERQELRQEVRASVFCATARTLTANMFVCAVFYMYNFLYYTI